MGVLDLSWTRHSHSCLRAFAPFSLLGTSFLSSHWPLPQLPQASAQLLSSEWGLPWPPYLKLQFSDTPPPSLPPPHAPSLFLVFLFFPMVFITYVYAIYFIPYFCCCCCAPDQNLGLTAGTRPVLFTAESLEPRGLRQCLGHTVARWMHVEWSRY